MIKVRDVHKQFGAQIVLNGLNLEILPGQTTAIVGPSGVGKSVLLKLIMGIMRPDSGSIEVLNKDMVATRSEAERNAIRADLGVLFQSAALFDSLTVYDNIAFPLVERKLCSRRDVKRRVLEMVEALSLQPYLAKLPQEISMGIRKRVGMARSLITEPKVILIDEPNTGLDPLVGQEVYDLIKGCRTRWGFAGVVISHEIPEVFQVADRVAMIFNGAIVEEGPPAQLMSSQHPAVQQFFSGRVDGPIRIN